MNRYKLPLLAACLLAGISTASFASVSQPWLIRLRALFVAPNASSTTITTIEGNVDDISTQAVPELDFSYFFTENIALNLILATSRHAVEAHRTIVGPVDLGRVALLPPTLSLEYHFFCYDCTFRPYLGVGFNYTHFYDVAYGPVASHISYTDNAGVSLQAGFDLKMNERWFFNFDVKKVFIHSTASVNVPGTGVVTSRVTLDPFIYGFGFGYRL